MPQDKNTLEHSIMRYFRILKKNMNDTFDLNVGYLWNDSKSTGYASKNTLHSSGAPFPGAGGDQFLASLLDFTLLLRKGETCLASSKSCILLTMMRWCRVAPKSSDSSTWERSAAAFSIFLGGVFAQVEAWAGSSGNSAYGPRNCQGELFTLLSRSWYADFV